MSEHNDGGPAFPMAPMMKADGTLMSYGDMSLLDWFAGQGILTAAISMSDPKAAKPDSQPSDIAKRAYEIGRAMLAERAKAQGGQEP